MGLSGRQGGNKRVAQQTCCLQGPEDRQEASYETKTSLQPAKNRSECRKAGRAAKGLRVVGKVKYWS